MINYKIQLEELKKELSKLPDDLNKWNGDSLLLDVELRTKISLREQDIDDLKKEWNALKEHKDETELWEGSNARCEHSDCHCEAEPIIEFIEQQLGMSSEELKEVQNDI